jgi:hypothetical protein
MQLYKTITLVLLTAAAATAQNLLIDDFTTGLLSPQVYTSGATNRNLQTGHMMGGTRDTNMNVCAPAYCSTQNPYAQPSSIAFLAKTATQPAAMVQTAGYFSGPRIDMGYGYQNHIDEYFAGYQKIRLSFQALTEPLNFNILLYTGGYYAQGGCNINPYSLPFTVELPLNKFVVNKGFDFAHVTAIDFIFQTASAIGGTSFAITSIQLANDTATGPVVSCHF